MNNSSSYREQAKRCGHRPNKALHSFEDKLDQLYTKKQEFEFMSDPKPVISSGGMRGQSAGSTAICTVGKEGIRSDRNPVRSIPSTSGSLN